MRDGAHIHESAPPSIYTLLLLSVSFAKAISSFLIHFEMERFLKTPRRQLFLVIWTHIIKQFNSVECRGRVQFTWLKFGVAAVDKCLKLIRKADISPEYDLDGVRPFAQLTYSWIIWFELLYDAIWILISFFFLGKLAGAYYKRWIFLTNVFSVLM